MLNEAWNLFPYSEILSDIHGHLKKNLPHSELNPLNRNPPFLHSTLTHSASCSSNNSTVPNIKLEVASHDKIVSIILLTCNPDGLLRNDKVMMGQVHVHARRRTALEYRCWCESGQLVWRREARSWYFWETRWSIGDGWSNFVQQYPLKWEWWTCLWRMIGRKVLGC